MIHNDISRELEGERIKVIFKEAQAIAALHNTITSPRGDYFRRRLLQALEVEQEVSQLEELREAADLRESHRHLNKLLESGLIRTLDGKAGESYVRTELGEKAINVLRALERSIGKAEATKIYEAALGPNSIRLFLRVYGNKKEVDLEKSDVRYTPFEMGRLSLFLPRSIEGISAVDKLNEAGLVSYEDDGFIYVRPRRARAFYQYLRSLIEILQGHQDAG